jgi:hypothetical protein
MGLITSWFAFGYWSSVCGGSSDGGDDGGGGSSGGKSERTHYLQQAGLSQKALLLLPQLGQ